MTIIEVSESDLAEMRRLYSADIELVVRADDLLAQGRAELRRSADIEAEAARIEAAIARMIEGAR